MAIDFSPFWISLQTAVAAIIVVFFLGILVAWWVLRQRSEAVRILLDGFLTLPLVLPPTVAGFFLLYIFGNNRPGGRFFMDVFGIQIAFSWLATVLAAVVIAFPLMYRSARAALEQVDTEYVQAARTLGMSEHSIFRRVLLPNALPGIVSGGLLAFARALGEFGATAMIAGNIAGRTRTLPLAVYASVMSGDIDTAAVYVSVIVCICLVVVVCMNTYLYKARHRKEG